MKSTACEFRSGCTKKEDFGALLVIDPVAAYWQVPNIIFLEFRRRTYAEIELNLRMRVSVKPKFILVDDNTKYFLRGENDVEIADLPVELIFCGEDDTNGSLIRARRCLENLRNTLDDINLGGSSNVVAGFILDIQIPVPDLSLFSDILNAVDTNGGADTGFQIARYVLHNERPFVSPYGNTFSDIPILFLSLNDYMHNSDFRSSYTEWMKNMYQPFRDTKLSKYMHLQKSYASRDISLIIKWTKLVIRSENKY